MSQKKLYSVEKVFRKAKKTDEKIAKDLFARLDCIEKDMQANFIVSYAKECRILAGTLAFAKTHVIS